MKQLQFTQIGQAWVALATIEAATNIHIEREEAGVLAISRRTGNLGEYATLPGYGYTDNFDAVSDIDLDFGLYPKDIKIVSYSRVKSATIHTPGVIICTDESNAELMTAARSLGWVASDATYMTEADALAVTSLPTGGTTFKPVKHFDELMYFMSLEELPATAFQNCTSLTSVVIPDGVTSIGDGAFYGCYALEAINIPGKLVNIGPNAFSYCRAITSVTIPAGVTNIGRCAFIDCTALTSVTCEPVTPPNIGDYVFRVSDDLVIYVPADSVEAYKGATNWITYASAIEAINN